MNIYCATHIKTYISFIAITTIINIIIVVLNVRYGSITMLIHSERENIIICIQKSCVVQFSMPVMGEVGLWIYLHYLRKMIIVVQAV